MNDDWVLMGAKDPERRYRSISVAVDLLAGILGGGFSDVTPMEPVPDLRIVGVRARSWTATIELLVTSETFEPLSESAEAGSVTWTPSFRRHTDGD